MNKNILVVLTLILVLFSNTVAGAGWTTESSFTNPEATCQDALVANGIEGDGTEALYVVGSNADTVYQSKWNSGTSQWDNTNVGALSGANVLAIGTGNLNGSRANPQLYVVRQTTSNCVYEIYYEEGWNKELIDASCTGSAYDLTAGDGRGTGTDYLYVTDSSGSITEYHYSGGWVEAEVATLPAAAWGITIANADPNSQSPKQLYAITSTGSIYEIEWDSGSSIWGEAQEIVSGLNYGRHLYSADIDGDELDELIFEQTTTNGAVYISQWDDIEAQWITTTLSSKTYLAYNMSYGDGDNDNSSEFYYGSAQYWGGMFSYDKSTETYTVDNIGYHSGYQVYCSAVGDADNDGSNEVYTVSSAGLVYKTVSGPITVSPSATRQENKLGVGCDYYSGKLWTAEYLSPVYSNTTLWIDKTPSDNDFSWDETSAKNPGQYYTATNDAEYWHANKPACAHGFLYSGNYRYGHKIPPTNYWGTDYVIPYAQGSYPNTDLQIVGLHDNTTYSIGGQTGNTINAGEIDTWNDEAWGTGNLISADKAIAVYLRYNSPLTPTDKLGQSFFVPPFDSSIGTLFVAPSENSTTVYVDADNDGVADETHSSLNVGSTVTLTNTDAGTHVYANKPIHLGMEGKTGTGMGWNDVVPVDALSNAYYLGYAGYAGSDYDYAMAIEPNTKVESHGRQNTYDSTTLSDFGNSYNLTNESFKSTIYGDKPFWYGYFYTYSTYSNSTTLACPMSQAVENQMSPRVAALGETQAYTARLFTMDVSLTDINGTFYIPDDYTLQGDSGVTVTIAKYGANSDQLVETTTAELSIPTPANGKYTLHLSTSDAAQVLDALSVDQYLQISFDVSPNTASTYEIEPAEFGYTANTYSYTDPLA